eukprot:scaffold3445_cov57-Attheya_sp.AAC.5
MNWMLQISNICFRLILLLPFTISAGMTSITHKSADSTPSSKASWPQLQPPLEGYDPVEYYEDTNYGVMSVPACMNYVGRECDDIYTRRDLSGTDSDLVGATWAPTNVRVKNARHEGKTLDLNGRMSWIATILIASGLSLNPFKKRGEDAI